MDNKKRNYHKESSYKAQKKWAISSDLVRIGVSIHQPEYNRLKELADASDLSMSKFIIKILKKEFPEVFND